MGPGSPSELPQGRTLCKYPSLLLINKSLTLELIHVLLLATAQHTEVGMWPRAHFPLWLQKPNIPARLCLPFPAPIQLCGAVAMLSILPTHSPTPGSVRWGFPSALGAGGAGYPHITSSPQQMGRPHPDRIPGGAASLDAESA